MIQAETNRIQDQILFDISTGKAGLPTNHKELYDFTLHAMTVIDHELEERKDMHDCLRCFLSTSLKRSDEIGFVYRSIPIGVLKRRKYFERLSLRTNARGVDAMRHVELALVENKSIVRVGSQIRVTTKGELYFNELNREIGIPLLSPSFKQLTN